MAAGPVLLTVQTQSGATAQIWHWSSDGTVNGHLSPMPLIGDTNQNALLTTASPGFTNTQDIAKTTGTITAADSLTTSVANALGQTVVTGSPTPNSSVVVPVSGDGTLRAMLTASAATGTVLFEKSMDGGTTYLGPNGSAPNQSLLQSAATFSTSSQSQFFNFNAAGCTHIRFRASALSAGSIAVAARPGESVRELAIPGAVYASTNARRSASTTHRSAITAADKISAPATPTLTGATVTGGGLASGTTYGVAVAAVNACGNTTPTLATSTSPGGSNNSLYTAIAQVANAVAYDLFIGTSVASGLPWVGRITEAQRAAGGNAINAVGTVTTAGAAPAGSVSLGVVGTGQTHISQTYLYNTAYYLTGITPTACVGYSRLNIFAALSLTDLRTAPSLVLVPAIQNQGDSAYDLGSPITLPVSGAAGGGLSQTFDLDVNGAANVTLLIDTITGQGASATIKGELS